MGDNLMTKRNYILLLLILTSLVVLNGCDIKFVSSKDKKTDEEKAIENIESNELEDQDNEIANDKDTFYDEDTENTNDKVVSTNSDKQSTSNEIGSIEINKPVILNDLTITLNNVRILEASEYDLLQEDKYLVANITLENNSKDKEMNFSYSMTYTIIDDERYLYHNSFKSDGVKALPSGLIEPGEFIRGEVVFDVPHSDHYEIQIQYFDYDDETYANDTEVAKWHIEDAQITN